MALLTRDRLRELLDYDPQSGIFRWRQERRGGVKAGDVAGCVHGAGKYRRWQIVIDRRHYKAHRLAWLYIHGTWPERIDHRNGNALDNRIGNLRVATQAENMANSVHPKGSTGLRGVSFYKNGYMAQISHKGRSVYIGRYATAEEAHAAWREAATRLRGDFARHD